ncbi:uncharacterized protein [Hetaerina americana]|uniref:uncharacterized protein n=1 Tax=Hetaerina americana TaxID=62018 RepID=UPI003A7F5A63
MEAQEANDSLSKEERLFNSIINGSSLSECEGLLGEVENIDAKYMQGRTALHLAVMMGKYDWVQRLLRMGADPRVRDGEGDDILHIAEIMRNSSPDDAILRDRMKILMLVRMVHKRVGVQNRFQSVLMAPVNSEIGMSERIESPRETIVEQNRELRSRDALLMALESGVTSLVEKSNSLEGTVRGRAARGGVAGASVVVTEGEWVDAREREFVDAMMQITTIWDDDFRKECFVRGIYKKLQSESPLTAAILRFIVKQPGVSIHIDCSSSSISNMKGSVKDHNGVMKSGYTLTSFVDFSARRVYVAENGMTIIRGNLEVHEMDSVCASLLVGALCQLAMYIAFENGGRPYAKDDTPNRWHFEDILLHALKMKETHTDLNPVVKDALKDLKRLTMELSLISTVPQMIAQYGLNSKEVSEHRRLFPLLFEYFEGHVIRTLEPIVSP